MSQPFLETAFLESYGLIATGELAVSNRLPDTQLVASYSYAQTTAFRRSGVLVSNDFLETIFRDSSRFAHTLTDNATAGEFDPTAPSSPSVKLVPSAEFSASSLDITPIFELTDDFLATIPFLPSLTLELSNPWFGTLAFVATASFPHPDRTPFPTDTPLADGVSIIYEDSMTVSLTVSASESFIDVSTVSETIVDTFGHSVWVFEDSNGATTYSVSYGSYQVVKTVVVNYRSVVLIGLPVYMTRVVRISRAVWLATSEAPADSSIDSGTLIGGIIGAATVLVLIVGATIFLVRSRMRDNASLEPEISPNDKDFVDAPQMVSLDDDVNGDDNEMDLELQQSIKQYAGDDLDGDPFDLMPMTDDDSIFRCHSFP
jgi:hypothetical protein